MSTSPLRTSAFRRPTTDWRQRATWGMAIGLLTALATLLLLTRLPTGSALENDTLDFWFRLRGPQSSQDVAILAVDETTVRRWGGRTFDAVEVGRLVRLLRQHGARAVALSFHNFTDPALPPNTAPQRDSFARDLTQCGIAHLPIIIQALPARVASATDDSTLESATAAPAAPVSRFALGAAVDTDNVSKGHRTVLLAPHAGLLQAAAGVGHLAFGLDKDGRARTLPLALSYQGQWYPALAVSAVLQATGGKPLTTLPGQPQGAPVDLVDAHSVTIGERLIAAPGGTMLLNYPYGPIGDEASRAPFQTLSVAAALDKPQRLAALHGKVVIVGPTALGAALFATPTGQRIAAVELNAIAIDNLLTGRALERAPLWSLALLTILLCMVVGGFVAARHPWWSGLVALLALAVVATLSLGLFNQNLWLDVTASWLGIGLTFLIGVIGRARRETREATRVGATIEALTQVSEVITAQTHTRDLLDRVLLWAEQVMQAAGASALLLDESGETLHFAAATGPKASEVLPFTLKVGEGVAGWVAQHGKPAIVNETQQDRRFAHNIDESTGFSTQSILCVPVRLRDKMLGVIEVINRVDGSPFDEGDAELLMAVANQAAVVLENARLYERLNQRVVISEGELAVTNQRLEAERNLLHTVLQSMTNGVVVVDDGGLIQLVNPAAAALLPELEADVKGHLLAETLPDFGLSTRQTARGMVATDLQRGDIDTPRLIEAHAAPLRRAEGTATGTVIVFDDVTEERNIERMKSDFVSFVAHEMRSPLTSISGFSAMLQRSESTAGDNPATATRARFLAIIHDESERLTRLINNLLDVARIEAGHNIELHREECDFAAITAQAVEIQRGYSRRHQIVLDMPPALPTVFADRDKVTQILINLLSNALKYSPGGTVTVAAQADEIFVTVTVSDQGPGIAPEQRARLFQRFGRLGAKGAPRSSGAGERAKPTGTGLGLFLTRHLIEAHGGRIWADSVPGHGAAFSFTLPLAHGPLAHGPLAHDATHEPSVRAAPAGETVTNSEVTLA